MRSLVVWLVVACASCASPTAETRANGPASTSQPEAPRAPSIHAFDPDFAPTTLSVGPAGSGHAHHHHDAPAMSAMPEEKHAP